MLVGGFEEGKECSEGSFKVGQFSVASPCRKPPSSDAPLPPGARQLAVFCLLASERALMERSRGGEQSAGLRKRGLPRRQPLGGQLDSRSSRRPQGRFRRHQ